MKFKYPISIQDIANSYNLTIIGNDKLMATGLNEIHKVEDGDITFVDNEKYYSKSLNSDATIIIIDKEVQCPQGKALLLHENPFEIFNDLAKKHRPFKRYDGNIRFNNIGDSSIIEPGVHIAEDVTIGEGCYIQAGAYIGNHTIIGNNVTVQAGAIIGTDAFYFKKEEGKYTKWHSSGRVIIEDNVSIGAGCTINKGVSGDTIIGNGTKLDCQVHIGHGVVIGKNCLLAAQVGIGGKTVVGNNVVMYGQVGVAQNLEIADNVAILAKSGVSKNLEADKVYFGYPAQEAKQCYKELATLRQLVSQKLKA
ncbi:MAG TPA: UDP-3-O-(3-hydroxymyristoyl)glucosamine N-acyltransferase [Saprospiraceae bacterium]|nr:UDP-3-O-(3-hydroxymyristoyl)glucosamine N-acyltransferase [Saprospiraceae bacterium]